MTKHSSTTQRINRAQKKKKYKRLLKYSGNVKYTPCKELAQYIVKHVTKDLPRLRAERLLQTIRLRLHQLPLDINTDAYSCNFVRHPKILWYKFHTDDKYIHQELLRYFRKKCYTSYTWTKESNTIFIHTYN